MQNIFNQLLNYNHVSIYNETCTKFLSNECVSIPYTYDLLTLYNLDNKKEAMLLKIYYLCGFFELLISKPLSTSQKDLIKSSVIAACDSDAQFTTLIMQDQELYGAYDLFVKYKETYHTYFSHILLEYLKLDFILHQIINNYNLHHSSIIFLNHISNLLSHSSIQDFIKIFIQYGKILGCKFHINI